MEQRKRAFTDEDLQVLAKMITDHQDSHCRYNIDPARMDAAIRFFENINSILEDSKKTVRRALLILAVAGFVALLGAGTAYKIWAIASKGAP
jgi:hypothetical protein